jgi:hypothetical protein
MEHFNFICTCYRVIGRGMYPVDAALAKFKDSVSPTYRIVLKTAFPRTSYTLTDIKDVIRMIDDGSSP